MRKLISAKLAGNILIILLALLAVFHLLIIFRVIPPTVAWGGQVSDPAQDVVLLEVIALLVLLIFILVIASKTGYTRFSKYRKTAYVGIWVIFAYFVLNTFGNLASSVALENLLFAPLTILLSLLSLRLAIEK